jgi:hypothetical protein
MLGRGGDMKFMDVVHNGVLQAHGRMQRGPRRQGMRLPGPSRQKRLLDYKGERVVRSMVGAKGRLQVIFD